MRRKHLLWLLTSVLLFLAIISPRIGKAADIIYTVDKKVSTDDTHFHSIQTAIEAAVVSAATYTLNRYIVQVEPDTYAETISLKSRVSVQGRETARTILTGGGTGTIVTANGVNNVSFSNFTLSAASVGVSIANSTSVSVLNNVFWMGSGGTALQNQNSTSTTIINNTFYQNGTAISRDTDITIRQNVFSTNTLAIQRFASSALVAYNLFFANIDDGDTGLNAIANNPDPLFVDIAARDFHLKQNSPCIDAGDSSPQYNDRFDGSTNDLGAYGGPSSDTTPFPVSILSATLASSSTISVSWSANNSYLVTNTDPVKQGGYNIYYSLNDSGPPYQTSSSVISTSTSSVISGLTTSTAKPEAPVLNALGIANGTLLLSWSPVETATSYNVYYLDTVTSVENVVPVGKNQTSYSITGLINNRDYTVTVTAVAQPVYNIAITAFDHIGPTYDPGIQHESAYSAEASVPVGTPNESDRSNGRTDYPEAITPYPDLPNNGCFIATAAYGYYSAPQVQALREFRDRYLMTNSAGKAFVQWYYHYGPVGAEFINAHPWLKPLVRVALMPLVGGALFMLGTSLLAKVILMVFIGLMSVYLVQRRKLFRSGGTH